MVWQDFSITAANVLISYALVPQVYKNFKERKQNVDFQTSAITSLALYTLAVSFFTLNLYFSSATLFINAFLWTIILIQGIIYKS